MLKKLFGGKKSAYFLELDESKDLESAKEKAEALAKPVKEKAEALAKSVKEKAEPAKTLKAEAPKTEASQAKKTSVKNNAKAAPAQAESAPKSKPTVSDPEEIVRAAVFKNSSNGKAESQTSGFASNNVIVPTLSRRRPGPSLNMFKNMARQAKTPKS